MAPRREATPWHYFRNASAASLESYELSRLNHAANLRKEIAALIDEWVEETAQARLARWVRDSRILPPVDSTELCPQAELPLSEPPARPRPAMPRFGRRAVRIRAG